MHHGRCDEAERMLAQFKAVAFFYDIRAAAQICSKKLLHHIGGRHGCLYPCIWILIQKRQKRPGMIRLHMLYHYVIYVPASQVFIQI